MAGGDSIGDEDVADLPAIAVDFSPVSSTTNPLGAKGIGEGGAVAAATGAPRPGERPGCL